MSDLIDHGKVLRSWIGVQIQPIDDTAARALDVKTRSGALVADVVNKGPAEKAGVETGDVIVEFNNLKINSVDHLRNTVSSSKPNRSYELVVIREGRKKRLKVILEEMPGDDVVVSSTRPNKTNELGIEVSELTRSNRRKFGISNKEDGVVVINVQPGSPAENTGIQIGDIITRVGTKKCRTSREFQKLLKETKRKNMVMLHLKRDGAARYLTLELED
jgi:serine protease Do